MSDALEAELINEPPLQQISPTPKRKHLQMLKQLFALVAPYWKSEEKGLAWMLLITSLSLNMAGIYLAVQLNEWSAQFYNALQTLDKVIFSSLLYKFIGLVLCSVVLFVSAQFTQAYLAFRWRIWLTKNVMHDWLDNSNFARLFTYNYKTENPDQRISQDLNLFTTKGLDLSFSLLTEFIRCLTFAVILWSLSNSLLLPWFGGKQLAIPGYMLWFTIIYVSIATVTIYKTGKPLIGLDYTQEKVEANFRFNLMRIRERRDEVSILHGEKAEAKFLNTNIFDIVKNYNNIIRRNIFVNSFQNVFLNFSTILPILAAAPMFFSGVITLGVLMQIANAFSRVQDAMMVFAMNFQTFASWQATFNRISDFREEIADLKHKHSKPENELYINMSRSNALAVQDLTLHLPEMQNLAKFNFKVEPHERVLIMGRSGLGKSTLLKCIAGLWPYALGAINKSDQLLIVPQKPYFPINTLRNCLLYPHIDKEISDQELHRVLEICSLQILKGRLDEVSDWLSILSLGEQQRLNFARVILAKPKSLIMDEPTASMDKALESKLFATLYQELPDITLLTIGHALSLRELHTRCIDL